MFFSAVFRGKSKKHQMIDWAIKHLADEGALVGTAFKEISHLDVMSYIEKNNCKVIQVIPRARGDWVEFHAMVEGTTYVVRLDTTFSGDGSVLTSHSA